MAGQSLHEDHEKSLREAVNMKPGLPYEVESAQEKTVSCRQQTWSDKTSQPFDGRHTRALGFGVCIAGFSSRFILPHPYPSLGWQCIFYTIVC